MGVRLIKYFLNEKSEKHKSYISLSADPIKTSEKQTILKKKPDIINQLQMMNTLLISAMANSKLCTISDKATQCTDCA